MIRHEECIFFRVDLCSVWLHLVEIKFRKVTWFSCTEVRLSFDWYNFVFFLFSCEWRRSRNKDDVVRIGGSNHSITKRWSIMIIYDIEGKNVLRDIVYIYIYIQWQLLTSVYLIDRTLIVNLENRDSGPNGDWRHNQQSSIRCCQSIVFLHHLSPRSVHNFWCNNLVAPFASLLDTIFTTANWPNTP